MATTLVYLVTAKKIKYSFEFVVYAAHVPDDKLELVTCLHNRSWADGAVGEKTGVQTLFCHLTGQNHFSSHVDDVFKELEGIFEPVDPIPPSLSDGIVVLCQGDYDWEK
jgi:hypothetical protein